MTTVQVPQTRSQAIHSPSLTKQERAALIVLHVIKASKLIGVRGDEMGQWDFTLVQLAERGVPANHELPFDTDELRALVREYAELEVETTFSVRSKLAIWMLEL